jgi:hydroxypyruvate isomerase
MMNDPVAPIVMSRRGTLVAAGAPAAALLGRAMPATAGANETPGPVVRNGRIRQSISMSCLRGMKLEQAAPLLARLGIKGVDLQTPAEFPLLKKHGLLCTMTRTHSLTQGLNHKANHAECLARIREAIEATAEAGFPNVITFPGNREGMSDEEGLRNCVAALKQVAGLAERKNVTICMELLNSKVNHKDYMCDHTAWGAAVVKAVGSERVKLLYDIYHMQVQEGDIIATIGKYKDCIAHYHTAGVPGRHEIDDTQELNYPAIMRAIVETGFKGYIGHEYGPKRDPVTSLIQAIKTCDV